MLPLLLKAAWAADVPEVQLNTEYHSWLVSRPAVRYGLLSRSVWKPCAALASSPIDM